MRRTPRPPGPVVAGLGTLVLVALAVPLLGPSCGSFSPGVKTFAKGSLIIPMDVCYQCSLQSADGFNTTTGSCSLTSYRSPSGNACPQKLAQGNVMEAYGLVYQLIRNNIAVYWVIDPQKAALDGYDLSIQYDAGAPVQVYDWSANAAGAAPTAGATIRYMGGPFVVDGSDQARAFAVLQAYKGTFQGVNVHVSGVAFQANVAKAMAGGWSAGDAVPPKLALLNIASGLLSPHGTQGVCTGPGDPQHSCNSQVCLSQVKNSEPVIEGYLSAAGIGTGTAGGSSTGPHGQIYDRLDVSDFVPSTAGDWTTTNLYRNGYQILWVPHWVAPGSCTDPTTTCSCLATLLTSAQVTTILQTIGQFNLPVPAGRAPGDVFAECAGLGSFEGAFNYKSNTTYDYSYQAGDPSTRFQSLTGLRYNEIPDNPFPPPQEPANFASPLLQIGDFPFKPYGGFIEDYRPADASAGGGYQPNVTRLIEGSLLSGTDYSAWNYFTLRPGDSTHGTVVYLAGHSYSGVQGNFQIGASRLVVNTLFNLGAACVASGVSCDTGLLGACSKGVLSCQNGVQVCSQTVFPTPEVCNGVDDDCNGLVDDGLQKSCYDGPAGTAGVGLCHAGVANCVQLPDGSYGYSACAGEVLPADEVCNGLDDNCNGYIDENPATVPTTPGGTAPQPLSQSCYDGPSTSLDPTTGLPRGACKAGAQTCAGGTWGSCVGEVLPVANPCLSPEIGGTAQDLNCDGIIDVCGACTDGQVRSCYDGPAGTAGVGICHTGTQTCASSAWGPCVGEVLPEKEICNDGINQNCLGMQYDTAPLCTACTYSADPAKNQTIPCWTGPAGVVFAAPGNTSTCAKGTQACQPNGTYASTCEGQTLPGQELCNGKDDNCNGLVDDGAVCGPGFACVNGVCVFDTCAPEVPCRDGYACAGVPGQCALAPCCADPSCATSTVCPAGTLCNAGACDDPCAGITCGPGASCAGGFCTGGACYEVGCPSGQLCLRGACAPDPCQGVLCPDGTFCRQGDCVQACAFVTCPAGQSCGVDGFCAADPCLGVSCGPAQTCAGGSCATDPCVGIGCGNGQVCQAGQCVDDPCTGIVCPTGTCRGGQCFAISTTSSTPPPKHGGCGCGDGTSSPLALVGLLALLPLARRGRRGRRGPSGGWRGALPLVALLVALGASGCKKAATFDPASCTAAGVNLAVCTGESRCIDLSNDPSHCGTCAQPCSAGQICVDAVCGPSSAVAPQITGLSPGSAPRGALAPIPVALTGARFDPGATLRASFSGVTSTYATNVTDAAHLSAAIDLTTAVPGVWELQVVNPDRVISNQVPLGVVLPTPTVTGLLLPAGGVSVGQVDAVTAVGTGLMVDSTCLVSGPGFVLQAVPSSLTQAGLVCTVDLTGASPGPYQLTVQNFDPAHASAPQNLLASSAAPVLTALSPSTAQPGQVVALTLTGSGFDATSTATFAQGNAFPAGVVENTGFVSSTQLIVPQLDLSTCPGTGSPPQPCPAGTYEISVANGNLISNALPLVLVANAPTVTSLSPTTATQGDQITLTVNGGNLVPATTVIQVAPPGGAFADCAPTTGSPTAVSCALSLIGSPPGSLPAGTYSVRLRFTDSGTFSGTLSLRVLSNTAVIIEPPAPAGGVAGTVVPVTLTVSNLLPPQAGVSVIFSGAAAPLTPVFPAAGEVAVSLDLHGLATGVYTLAVVNPSGAAPSNTVTFTVTPGKPLVAGVACAPAATSCTAGSPPSAAQQPAPVPLVLTGSNFATPDATGANGSVVHVFTGCTPVAGAAGTVNAFSCPQATSPWVPDYALPAAQVNVVSATEIDVALDTTAAVPATYGVWVQNPGVDPSDGLPPQLSNALPGVFTITP